MRVVGIVELVQQVYICSRCYVTEIRSWQDRNLTLDLFQKILLVICLDSLVPQGNCGLGGADCVLGKLDLLNYTWGARQGYIAGLEDYDLGYIALGCGYTVPVRRHGPDTQEQERVIDEVDRTEVNDLC